MQIITTSPLEILLYFLPSEERKVTRACIHFLGLTYWHDDLAPFIGEGRIRVYYDPRTIRFVYVRCADGTIVQADVREDVPDVSHWEWAFQKRNAPGNDRAEKRDAAAQALGVETADKLVRKSKAKTRAAHKHAAKAAEHRKGAEQTHSRKREPAQPPKARQDFDPTTPVSNLDVEIIDVVH